MHERRSRAERLRSALLWWTGIVLGVVIWHLVARSQPAYVLPSPQAAWEALLELIRSKRLGTALLLTIERGATGLGVSCLVGMPLGWAMGTWTWLRELLDSWMQILLSVPPIVIVVVGMIWLVVLVVALVPLPLLATTVRDAVAGVDPDLLDMSRVFARSRAWTIRRIILPAVAPPVLSALTVAVGQSVRVTVMSELLSTTTGLGAMVQRARTNLNTDDVFALSVVMAVLTLALELCILGPLRRRLSRPSV